jgi:hypothetical protein
MAGEFFYVTTLPIPAVIQNQRRTNGIWVSDINKTILTRKNKMLGKAAPVPLHHKSHMDWPVVKLVPAV